MKIFLTSFIVFGLAACNQMKPDGDTKTMEFGSFKIVTPLSWKPIKKSGIDSYVGSIAIDDTDTLNFDLGWYSNKLYEYDPTILDSSMISSINTSMLDTSEVIFVKNRMRVDPDGYRKNNVSWDTIDGRKAKIVYPRQPGIGITGVYIDSLWVSGSSLDRFNLYGENLKPETEQKVLQALRTIKFVKK